MTDTAMTPNELRAALQLKPSTFYKHSARGTFDRFELLPRIGPHRYSRKVVQAYLDRAGVPETVPLRLRRPTLRSV